MKLIKNNKDNNEIRKYKFIPLRLILGISIFIFLNLIFYLLNSKFNYVPKQTAPGFSILIMIIFIIFAVITDRSFRIITRIFWAIGMYLLESFLVIPMKTFVGNSKDMYNFSGDIVHYFGTTLASLIVVILAMRRSRYFVKPINKNNKIKKYKFIYIRFISWIFIFILVSFVFYLLYLYNSIPKETALGTTILIMLIFIIFTVITDRSWNIITRILWAIGAFFLQGILALPMKMTIGETKDIYNMSGDIVHYLGTLLSSLIIVIWAMRRSRYFVKPIEND